MLSVTVEQFRMINCDVAMQSSNCSDNSGRCAATAYSRQLSYYRTLSYPAHLPVRIGLRCVQQAYHYCLFELRSIIRNTLRSVMIATLVYRLLEARCN